MPVVAIIPARYASSRFPGKPLAAETGKPLIQHVYEAVAGAKRIDRIIVATDDDRIAAAVRAFGGEVAMTRADHPSGTDRVAEVVAALRRQSDAAKGQGNGDDIDLVVNVQGDEPEMDPGAIDKLVTIMLERPGVGMGSIACPFKSEAELMNPACVKVVLDRDGYALYFSRSLVPYPRDAGGRPGDVSKWLLHLGIYAYRPECLARLTATPPCELEQTEQLEQLRALWLGERIAMAVVPDKSAGIDTPEQYAAFVRRYKAASR
ncbi:MAG TPA: 3-deoxy-manno-octulosonate cytidylyltransferase [Phycisphaerae bacterium]|nr:3-deoxy-manno-octulosonate cytidylyltransferase [Phycisphaerae bacterium]HOJ75347.1 3-deoxy-manno-octulosonate cytidylyltransferase [Phycisphaerae bacterium]HOM52586.1 3-deoxy-manno-octulosonate cytidylyltransferase [Phycisphaerae bacterium]HON69178.1 3-deoxy-manno-octulosonate cytidylyltransferase [Phycisphaerae bacterium]HOQ87471.1 3-deoxy-manno-octulosonate cytidylyltransferase [Phycisphaerae bacterium]